MLKMLSNPEEGMNNNSFNELSKKKSAKNIELTTKNKQVWSGVTNHTKSFESAKLESQQCL